VTANTGVTHREIDAGDGLRIHVTEYGSGPPVVLLHGFTGSTETWAPFLARFASKFRVIAIDQPGHGRSTSPSDVERYRLDRFAGDLATVLDSMNVDRAVVLGYSMGGRAALKFAAHNAKRVAGLVLESASPGIADEAQRFDRNAADADLADKVEREGVEAFVKYWETLSLWDSQNSLPRSAREELHRQRLSNNATGLANSLRGAGAGADVPSPGATASISVPTLLIAGALDSKYVEIGKSLHRVIPASRLDIIPDCGHTTHLERPQEFASVTMAFLDSIPSDGNRWA
jgi:2-succinyl-6-hydroxy-2,4-cyclohexadiene-1-carboxylate synthase